MTRISQYPIDEDIQGNDKWIGTSVSNANATKNFSVDKVSEYLNKTGSNDSQNLRYTYLNTDSYETRLPATISFPTLIIGDTVPFSSITEWIISAYSKPIKDVRTYYDAPLIGSTILITHASNPSNWAIFRWDSVTEDIDHPDFYTIGLTHIDSAGELVVNEDYLLALLQYDVNSNGAVWGNITGILSNQTDLQNALDEKVPYTGATSDVDLGEFELKAGQVEFDQTPIGATGVGVLRWNDTDGTLDLGLKGGNVTLQIGQEQVTRVVNKTGSTLQESNYQAVKVDGAQGQRLKIMLAQANNDANSADTLGIVTETIADNAEGFITTSGLVRNINTTGALQGETWADGDTVYLSGTVAGRLTNIKPTAPIHTVIIGYVVRAHATQGQIYVKVDNGYELNELHNVSANSPSDKDIIQYISATQLWTNVSLSGAGIQPTLVSGTNIRTINSTSLLGSGNISVQPTLVSGTNIKTINGNSLLGSGDISITTSVSWGGITGTLSDQVDLQSALNSKQATLVSGTNIKTINSSSLLGAGDIAVQETLVSGTNIKTINGASILGSGNITISGSTTWGSITGTLSSQTDLQSALNAKQDTLVSGTNIKTINGSSLLGSGNISISASPSGVAGAIQFSDGSAFASDAANLFWDDTNNRLGVGTNAPNSPLHIKGAGATSATYSVYTQNSTGGRLFLFTDEGQVGINVGPTAYLHVKSPYDGTQSIFKTENASATSLVNFQSNGINTFSFPEGGKVLIEGAVSGGSTLLEIRRTLSSSGGFKFISYNAGQQDLQTTNGAFNITTIDNSPIYLNSGTGIINLKTGVSSMTAFNTGNQITLGGGSTGIAGRWLNYGWNGSYGSLLQAVQNATTPAIDTLSLNPFGGGVGVGAILPTAKLHIKGTGSTSATVAFRVENSTNSNFVEVLDDGTLQVGQGGSVSKFNYLGPKSYRLQGSNLAHYINMEGGISVYTDDGTLSTVFDNAFTGFTDGLSVGKTTAPNSSSMLDIVSTTKGALLPRMTTTQRNAISTPATGLLVYDTDLLSFYQYNGTAWAEVGGGGGGTPSGVAGAIQFTDGSNFASDASNLFWDDTNNRLGIGLNTPSTQLHTKGVGNTSATSSFRAESLSGTSFMNYYDSGTLGIFSGSSSSLITAFGGYFYDIYANTGFGNSRIGLQNAMDLYSPDGTLAVRVNDAYTGIADAVAIGQTTAPVSQAMLELVSTTRGFLPPRMTTAQRDAISTPPDGLLLYNTTSKTFQYRINGAWEEFGMQSNAITSPSAGLNNTETIVVSTPVLTAGRFMTSTIIKISFSGTNTTTAANTSTFRVRIGTAGTTADTAVFSATTAASATSGTAIPFSGEIIITIRTVGATATAYGTLKLWNAGATGISTVLTQVINGTMASFNSTTANFVSLSYQSGANQTTSTFQTAVVEVID